MSVPYSSRFIRFTFPQLFALGIFGVDTIGCENSVRAGLPARRLDQKTEGIPPRL